jgi:hypothetical protein
LIYKALRRFDAFEKLVLATAKEFCFSFDFRTKVLNWKIIYHLIILLLRIRNWG